MIKKNCFLFILLTTMLSCTNKSEKTTITSVEDSIAIFKDILINKPEYKLSKLEINCDSIFKDEGIKVQLIALDTNTNRTSEPNYDYVFLVIKDKKRTEVELLRDTIISTAQEVQFIDFNNDNIKDILVQNISDVRSNWTYNLYVVNKNMNSLKKIKGFEEIKNPRYLKKYDLIDNEVMSGREWTSFYEITKDTIRDFGFVIYKGMDDKGEIADFEKDYEETLQKVLKIKKKK